jgi:hypothetical protein
MKSEKAEEAAQKSEAIRGWFTTFRERSHLYNGSAR